MKMLKRGTHARVTKGKKKEVLVEEGEPLDPTIQHRYVPKGDNVVLGISQGLTENLGDFRSVRVDAWIICETSKEDLTEAYATMQTTIDDMLGDSLLSVVAKMKKKK